MNNQPDKKVLKSKKAEEVKETIALLSISNLNSLLTLNAKLGIRNRVSRFNFELITKEKSKGCQFLVAELIGFSLDKLWRFVNQSQSYQQTAAKTGYTIGAIMGRLYFLRYTQNDFDNDPVFTSALKKICLVNLARRLRCFALQRVGYEKMFSIAEIQGFTEYVFFTLMADIFNGLMQDKEVSCINMLSQYITWIKDMYKNMLIMDGNSLKGGNLVLVTSYVTRVTNAFFSVYMQDFPVITPSMQDVEEFLKTASERATNVIENRNIEHAL